MSEREKASRGREMSEYTVRNPAVWRLCDRIYWILPRSLRIELWNIGRISFCRLCKACWLKGGVAG
jgi:hypothetical protein